jgi:hypothetical protein
MNRIGRSYVARNPTVRAVALTKSHRINGASLDTVRQHTALSLS